MIAIEEKCKCAVCGAEGNLIMRTGKHFKYWYCKCPKGHLPGVKKELTDLFQIGDKVRLYHVPFGINETIDYDTYYEGTVIEKEKWVTNYLISIKVEKSFMNGNALPKKSWVYGSVIRGVASDDESLELITKQMRLTI